MPDARYCTINGYPVLDPQEQFLWSQENNTPAEYVGKANSFSCPLGPEPGRGYFLMLRRDLDNIDKEADIELKWYDEINNATLTCSKLVFDKAFCVNRKVPGNDPNAAYLVEILDKRVFFKMSTIRAQYNVPLGYGVGTATAGVADYIEGTLNSGALWTWQTMLDDIWGFIATPGKGTAPTIPYTVGEFDGSTSTTYPEDLHFVGVSAWDALNACLDRLQLKLQYDPIADTFDYVRVGDTQTGLTSAQSALSSRLVYDYDPIESNRASVPYAVYVYFNRRDMHQLVTTSTSDDDLEEFRGNFHPSVQQDMRAANISSNPYNWLTTATFRHIHVTAEPDGTSSGVTIVPMWLDRSCETLAYQWLTPTNGGTNNSRSIDDGMDVITSNANVDNETELSRIGAQAAYFYRQRLLNGEKRERKWFSGIVTNVLPGERIKNVVWRDYGDGWGLITEHICGPDDEVLPPRKKLISPTNEAFQPPAFGRNRYPNYPQRTVSVYVAPTSTNTQAAMPVDYASQYMPYYVATFHGSGITAASGADSFNTPNPQACYATFNLRTEETDVTAISGGATFKNVPLKAGRYLGTFHHSVVVTGGSSVVYPVFEISEPQIEWPCVLLEDATVYWDDPNYFPVDMEPCQVQLYEYPLVEGTGTTSATLPVAITPAIKVEATPTMLRGGYSGAGNAPTQYASGTLGRAKLINGHWHLSWAPTMKRGTGISDPTGGTTVDSEARTAIDAIIDVLEDIGAIDD